MFSPWFLRPPFTCVPHRVYVGGPQYFPSLFFVYFVQKRVFFFCVNIGSPELLWKYAWQKSKSAVISKETKSSKVKVIVDHSFHHWFSLQEFRNDIFSIDEATSFPSSFAFFGPHRRLHWVATEWKRGLWIFTRKKIQADLPFACHQRKSQGLTCLIIFFR